MTYLKKAVKKECEYNTTSRNIRGDNTNSRDTATVLGRPHQPLQVATAEEEKLGTPPDNIRSNSNNRDNSQCWAPANARQQTTVGMPVIETSKQQHGRQQ